MDLTGGLSTCIHTCVITITIYISIHLATMVTILTTLGFNVVMANYPGIKGGVIAVTGIDNIWVVLGGESVSVLIKQVHSMLYGTLGVNRMSIIITL